MKRHLLLVATLPLLSACVRHAEQPKGPTIPPLNTVAAFVTPGMDLEQVEKKLSGHKPALTFTHENRGIWEYTERDTNPRTNAIHTHRLVVQFDPEGKVEKSTLTECHLPDVEPTTHTSPSTLCYRRLELPFDEKIVYDAIKRLLLNSNFQVEHSDAASRIIAANGMQPTKDKDEVMYMKVTVNFTSRLPNVTELVMSGTFNIVEKQMVWVQGGFAGVNLPIPLPFQKTEEWADTGLATPKFYMQFYDALENLISTEYLRYVRPLRVAAEPPKPVPPPTATATPIPNDDLETSQGGGRPTNINSRPHIDPAPIDEIDEFDGPIDRDPKPGKPKKPRPVDAAPIEESEDFDGPIDRDPKPGKKPAKKADLVPQEEFEPETEPQEIIEDDGPIDRDAPTTKPAAAKKDSKAKPKKKH